MQQIEFKLPKLPKTAFESKLTISNIVMLLLSIQTIALAHSVDAKKIEQVADEKIDQLIYIY